MVFPIQFGSCFLDVWVDPSGSVFDGFRLRRKLLEFALHPVRQHPILKFCLVEACDPRDGPTLNSESGRMPFNALWSLSGRLDWSMNLLKTSLTEPYPREKIPEIPAGTVYVKAEVIAPPPVFETHRLSQSPQSKTRMADARSHDA
jgi:hypothetical protein